MSQAGVIMLPDGTIQREANLIEDIQNENFTSNLVLNGNTGQINALKGSIGGFKIEGGKLTTTGAGLSSVAGVGKDNPAFWAGGTYNQAIGGAAKAIIRHDGTSKFTDTEITGKVNAKNGTIGGLNIYDNAIASYPDLGGLVPPGEQIHISKTGVSIDRNVGLSQNQVITSVRITDDGIRVSKLDSDGYKSMEVRIDGIYRNGVKIL